MVAEDRALSATVYELVKHGGKIFKLRWERVAGKVGMVDGIMGCKR
jgi:hypothetical protein